MASSVKILSSEELASLIHGIYRVREKIHWKTGKDLVHLNKRRRMGHLPPSASMVEYEQLIGELVKNGQNAVYFYQVGGDHYYAVRGLAHNRQWLVIFGKGGLMETAFPPENVDDYIERRGFILLGRVEEVLKWAEVEN